VQQTPNLGLRKPEGSDVVDIDDLNYNADVLDAEVTRLATASQPGRMSAVDKAKLDGATSAATPNTLVQRDPAGRMKAGAPSAADDVARKAEVDAVQTNLNNHANATTGVHGATSTATPNTLVQRDSAGRFKAAAPVAADDVARKAEVDAHATRTDNPHGTTAAQVGAPSLSVTIPNNVSLNTVVTSGFYRLSQNHPDAPNDNISHGQMIVSRGEDTVLQIITGWGNNNFYIRQGNPPEAGNPNGTWQPWRKLYHDGNNRMTLISPGVGYHIFANGFILQWGDLTIAANSSEIVIFPISFPNVFVLCLPVIDVTGEEPGGTVNMFNPTRSSVEIAHRGSSGTRVIRWMALGW
jgi:hypothetical protein